MVISFKNLKFDLNFIIIFDQDINSKFTIKFNLATNFNFVVDINQDIDFKFILNFNNQLIKINYILAIIS